MNFLLMMWIVIDAVLFILLFPSFRKQDAENKDKMPPRSIEGISRLGERIIDDLQLAFPMIFLILSIFVLLCQIPDLWIHTFLKLYNLVFYGALCSTLLSWIFDKKSSFRTIWKVMLFLSTAFLGAAGYVIEEENTEFFSQHRILINALITMLIVTAFFVLIRLKRESKESYSKKLPHKNIRKDIWYRTPRLMLNISNTELITACEKYFSEYRYRYGKIKELRTIEYVNLMKKHIDLWYAKVARLMKVIIVLNLFAVVLSMIKSMIAVVVSFEQILISAGIVLLIMVYIALIFAYKRIDKEYLQRIAIRYAYDEWGYYLTYAGGNKFVGNVQIISVSKYHKYIHSLLDIVALCRAVAFQDKLSGEKRISIITRSFSELFAYYTDEQNKSWTMLLPLWIAALFEFDVTGKIGDETKSTLIGTIDENVRFDISVFLHSFWSDMERRKLEDGISEYIRLFEAELYG